MLSAVNPSGRLAKRSRISSASRSKRGQPLWAPPTGKHTTQGGGAWVVGEGASSLSPVLHATYLSSSCSSLFAVTLLQGYG